MKCVAMGIGGVKKESIKGEGNGTKRATVRHRKGGSGDWGLTAMLNSPAESCLSLKFSSAKDLVP